VTKKKVEAALGPEVLPASAPAAQLTVGSFEPSRPGISRRLHAAKIDDPDGVAWHGEARQRWAEAELADPETPFMPYVGPALPDWSAQAPAHVTREILGRFLQDRGTKVVHDVYAAKPECLIDAICNGTFFHFWSEVVADTSVADDLPCPTCMS
jgi:hypothetical protein